jgi:hypothetical protein
MTPETDGARTGPCGLGKEDSRLRRERFDR